MTIQRYSFARRYLGAVPLAGLVAGLALGLPAVAQAQAQGQNQSQTDTGSITVDSSDGMAIQAETVTRFNQPWAMTFLPDGSMLVTEKRGRLVHVTPDGEQTDVGQMFEIAYGGHGGLGDVIVDPNFADNQRIYLSYAVSWDDGVSFGAEVASARLVMGEQGPVLEDVTKLWQQNPHEPGQGHYGYRLAIAPDNAAHPGDLFITSGDRKKLLPAQALDNNLGKVIRIATDGSVPAGGPFADHSELAGEFYTIGHRNPLGIDFDGEGNLWIHEMGPAHGDELNLIEAGDNYGWPTVSNGDHYSGIPMPDHDTRPEFHAPEVSWSSSIAPAGFVIYDGDAFEGWQGDGFIGGLVAEAIVRVSLDGTNSEEVARYGWGERIREVEQGPDGALWVLEDAPRDVAEDVIEARLVKLTPGQ